MPTLTHAQKISALYWIIAFVVAFVESKHQNDFRIFTAASTDLFSGSDVYTTTYFDGYHFFYGLCFAIFIYPFTLLPFGYGLFLWLLLNFFFLYRIGVLLNRYLKTEGLANANRYFVLGIFGLIGLRFMRDNIHFGQMTIYVLWSCMEAFDSIQQKRHLRAGILIALAIHVKLLLLVMVPWLAYRAQYKTVLYTVVGLGIFYILPALFIGWTHNLNLLSSWAHLINPTNAQHVLDVEERSFHGLSTWVPVFFMKNVYEPYALPLPRHVTSLTFEQMQWVLNGLRLILLFSCLPVLRSWPFKPEANALKSLNEVFFILALVPLIFPHQQAYAFFLQCPVLLTSILFVLHERKKNTHWKNNAILFLLITVALVFNLSLLLGHFAPYYEHYKIITWAGLILIPLALRMHTLRFR